MISPLFKTIAIASAVLVTSCGEQRIVRVSSTNNGILEAKIVENTGSSAADARIVSVYIQTSEDRSLSKRNIVFQVDNPDQVSIEWVGNNNLKIKFDGGYTNTYHNIWYNLNSDRPNKVNVELVPS
jgi:hypothetical protein